jgi:N utilization substance protein A
MRPMMTTPAAAARFGRIAAQNAKQVIVQKVREAERDQQFDEFKDRIGEVVNGTVKRVEYGNVIVDLGRGEAIVRRDELIPRETSAMATVCAPISTMCAASSAARRSSCRARIRVHGKLFTMEVPEIYDGIIEIKRRLPAIRVRAPRSP